MLLARDPAGFETFGTSHLVALAVLAVGAVALVAVGRRLRHSDPSDRFGKAFAVATVLVTLPLQVLYFTPDYWNLQTTLPIQFSDLASFVSVYALWTHRWWAVGLTYYWGLVLTPQALLTPDLGSDFPDPVFVLYWAMHIATTWAAVYLTFGRGLAPSWRAYRRTLAVTATWAAVVLTFNVVVGTNYAYLNAKPRNPSILDLLGPWPWYVVAEAAILVTVWALMTLPWERRPRHRPAAT